MGSHRRRFLYFGEYDKRFCGFGKPFFVLGQRFFELRERFLNFSQRFSCKAAPFFLIAEPFATIAQTVQSYRSFSRSRFALTLPAVGLVWLGGIVSLPPCFRGTRRVLGGSGGLSVWGGGRVLRVLFAMRKDLARLYAFREKTFKMYFAA